MKSKQLNHFLSQFEPFIKAIVELFHPFMEAAVHDLKEGKIIALYHNISQRKIGDSSPLHELKVKIQDFPDFFAPYYKRNWDGRELKCTSITIRNEKKIPIGLVCFNVDTSVMQDIHQLLSLFLKTKEEAENPIEAFGGNCEEQASSLIEDFLIENKLSLAHLNRTQKKQLVQHLYQKGLFNYKNAAVYLSNYLRVSRASVYNYINEIGE